MQVENPATSRSERAPKVSVCVVTYNQERYIHQCLQSIVDQETDFDFEVLVADDCSTDGTREIIEEFAQKYPRVVKPIFHERNIGAYANYVFVHKQAKGEYVAHVDGDDYYFNGKLQVQADFLDHESRCNVVWHRMLTLSKSGKLYEDNFPSIGIIGRKIYVQDVIGNVTVGLNSSKMYRRNALLEFPSCDIDYLDFADNVLRLSSEDNFASFVGNQPLGVYRANQGISFYQTNRIRRSIYKWLYYFYKHKLATRSTINAKIFWLLASDIRRLKSSMLIGVSLFTKTILSFHMNAIRSVRKARHGAINMFRETSG